LFVSFTNILFIFWKSIIILSFPELAITIGRDWDLEFIDFFTVRSNDK